MQVGKFYLTWPVGVPMVPEDLMAGFVLYSIPIVERGNAERPILGIFDYLVLLDKGHI